MKKTAFYRTETISRNHNSDTKIISLNILSTRTKLNYYLQIVLNIQRLYQDTKDVKTEDYFHDYVSFISFYLSLYLSVYNKFILACHNLSYYTICCVLKQYFSAMYVDYICFFILFYYIIYIKIYHKFITLYFCVT